MKNAICLFKSSNTSRIITIDDVPEKDYLGDYQRENGLVCPFCYQPVFFRSPHHRTTPKTKELIQIEASFCHYEADEGVTCENRAKTTEGLKEIEQQFSKSRGQTLALFEKHFEKEILVKYFLRSSVEKERYSLFKKHRKTLSRLNGENISIVREYWVNSIKFLDRYLNHLIEVVERYNDFQKIAKETEMAGLPYDLEVSGLKLLKVYPVFQAGVAITEKIQYAQTTDEYQKYFNQYFNRTVKLLFNEKIDWTLQRVYCREIWQFICNNDFMIQFLYDLSLGIIFIYVKSDEWKKQTSPESQERMLNMILVRIITVDWESTFKSLPKGFG